MNNLIIQAPYITVCSPLTRFYSLLVSLDDYIVISSDLDLSENADGRRYHVGKNFETLHVFLTVLMEFDRVPQKLFWYVLR